MADGGWQTVDGKRWMANGGWWVMWWVMVREREIFAFCLQTIAVTTNCCLGKTALGKYLVHNFMFTLTLY